MKRFLIFVLVLLLCFSVSACGSKKNYDSKTPVVINMPKDNTVNGYKTSESESYDSGIVDANSVTVGNPVISSEPTNGSTPSSSDSISAAEYCVNKNTHILHKSDCSSAKKMKEENKFYYNDRDKAVSDGYTPCKRCNP